MGIKFRLIYVNNNFSIFNCNLSITMTQMIRTLTLLSILIFTTHATQSGNKNNGKETCYQNGKTYQDSEIISSSAKCVDDNRLKGSEQVCENGKIKDKTFNHDCGQGYVCCTEDKSEVTCQKGSKCNNNNNDKNNYKAAAYADTNHHKPKGDMCYIGDRTYEDGEHILTIPVACIDDKMYSAQYAKCKNGGIKNKDKIYECAQGLVCCDVNTENEYNIGGAVCLEDCTEEPQACIIDDIKYESGESIHKIGLACSHQIVPDISVCNLPKVTGVCRAAIPRYYYNADTYRCEEFIYGGSNGNDNNFETLYECHQLCNNIIHICVPKGGSFMGDPETCTLIDFICGLDEDYWFDDKCGCGCKPKKIDIPDCVPDGWYYSGDNDFCVVAFIVCKDGYEHWSLPECGCGCKPKDINPPSACPLDIKKCSDGSYVNRNPLNNCEFDECPKCNQIKCLIEPCQFSSCDNYPNAICTSNYCNSCNAIWTDINGNDITNKCIKTTTTTTIKPQCVPDNWIFIGDNDLCSRILFDCDENS
eukprot:164449_1